MRNISKQVLYFFLVGSAAAGVTYLLGTKISFAPTQSPSPEEKPNVVLYAPNAGALVGSPFTIQGEARVFENVVNVRVRDAKGKVVLEDFTMTAAQDVGLFGPFSLDIFLPLLESPDVTLDAFWYSPKDGSELDIVSIPLKVKETSAIEVKVFFSNNTLDPEVTCTKVFPVSRKLTRTTQVARAALMQLLRGPSGEELGKGYFSAIPEGTKLNSIRIENGIAYADFSEELERAVGGSCRVAAISAQIRETLTQFPTVKSVVISINGRTGDVLQP